LSPVHHGEVDIGDHEIEPAPLEKLERGAAILDALELEADATGILALGRETNSLLEQIRHMRIVLDDEDAQLAREHLGIATADPADEARHALGRRALAQRELDAETMLVGAALPCPPDDPIERERNQQPREGEFDAHHGPDRQ